MTDVVAPARGLELFAPQEERAPLPITGKRALALGKLGIDSVQDLLQHYPRRHVDRTELKTIAELSAMAAEGWAGEVQVHARVVKINRPFRTRTGKRMITGRIGDETGSLPVTWFNQEWVARVLSAGTEAFFYGRLTPFRGKLQMTAPRFEPVKTGTEPFNVGRIIPIYPTTAELQSDQLRRLIWDALGTHGDIVDPLPEEVGVRLGLMPRSEALRLFHFPDSMEDVGKARHRLVFDEVFTLQLGLVYRKRKLERTVRGIAHPAPGPDSLGTAFVEGLPFTLTRAQKRACDEVAADLARSCPMHRLLEGEVGSGKTVVAMYGCLMAIEGGRQAAIMAPTEVLAEQHHLTVSDLLTRAFGATEGKDLFSSVSRRPVVRLLSGSTPAAQRAAILDEVASGDVDLLIGTHALIQEAVAFKDLGMVVVDEQHRFGVLQRKRLQEKSAGATPDVLVMTATPIPRTLAVTVYGDLDVSILDELPMGRRPVATSVVTDEAGRRNSFELIRSEVAAGRQAFIVYALRDESEKAELKSAKAEAVRLAREVFPDLSVGLVHGDMKSSEKEDAMAAFRDGRTHVLVATTVVEVGVDVPNATVMLIEDSDRFGLAQLHQLRGRVGRGGHDSYCILATDVDLARADEEGIVPGAGGAGPTALGGAVPAAAIVAERLGALARSHDGFELALTDLAQRGEGELFGARQSGMPQLRLARVLKHQTVIKSARDAAAVLLDADPELAEPEHRALRREMEARFPPGALEVMRSG